MARALHLPFTTPDPGAMMTTAALAAADALALTARQAARVLGLSEATLSRMKRGDCTMTEGSASFALAALLVGSFRRLQAMGGGDAAARAWIGAPHLVLGGRPVELIQTALGLGDVAAFLDAA